MEDSSPRQSLTVNPTHTVCSFPPYSRRPLRSRTYESLIRILSHCRPQLQMQGSVSKEDGSVTCAQVITTNLLVSPNSKESEDKVVGETSEGETKEKTGFQDSDSKLATPTKLLQPELLGDGGLALTSSNQIRVEDYLVVEEQMNGCSAQSTKELENASTLLDVQIEDVDKLKDDDMDWDSSFDLLNEVRKFNVCSDVVAETSEARQLSQEEDTVLEENTPKDVQYELHMKEMELEKLIYSSAKTDVSFSQISGEIEEGEISGDAGVADESFDVVSEGASPREKSSEILHASKGYFDVDLLEDKDRGRQQHGLSDLSQVNTVNIESNFKIVESKICAEQLQEDIPRPSHMKTPKSNDIHHCLENVTPPRGIHQDNASGNQFSMSSEMDEDAGKNKRKRGMTKERRAKKKKKERLKRAAKNRELGVKRLKLPTIVKPKKIDICRHYLLGRCHEGEKCKFSHDAVPHTKSKPCSHYARNCCMKGDQCTHDHQLSKYPCNNYVLNGFCHRGSDCMFSHEIAAKIRSETSSFPKHDLISRQLTVPEKQGSHPISMVNKSELKPPSPLNNPNCSRPMDSGISHQKVNSRLGSPANSPAQIEQLKPIPRSGGQAPKGVSFLQNGAVLLGNNNKDNQDESPARRSEDSSASCKGTVAAPGCTGELNGMPELVAPRKPQGINFLSFGQPPSDDSSNKILSKLLSVYNDGVGKSAVDDMGKGKLTCSLAQGAGTAIANKQMTKSCMSLVSDVTDKARGTSLTVPQNVKFLSFNRSHLNLSTSKETADLDSNKGNTALSFVKEKENSSKLKGMLSPSFGGQSRSGWSANLSSSFKNPLFSNTPSLVRKAVQSTLAFAAQLETDIKVESYHPQQ